jgi:hypothetical protein
MIYISHRGNLDGIIPERENSLDYIQEAIDAGYDVEIDLRMKNEQPHLGHDYAQYPVTEEWLWQRSERLWIHVKEYAALEWIFQRPLKLTKYFCHEFDRYTLVSNGWIWSHDLTNRMNSMCIIPLLSKESIAAYNQTGFGAVCSDFIYDCKKKFS